MYEGIQWFSPAQDVAHEVEVEFDAGMEVGMEAGWQGLRSVDGR